MNPLKQNAGILPLNIIIYDNNKTKLISIKFTKFIFILYYIMDKKINYYSNEEFTFTVKASEPIKAAKKIWRKYKYDSIFSIYERDTNQKFTFDPSQWSRKGKFLQN